MSEDQIIAQARDELFSHINRCGVLQASADDQSSWMDETIEYIGERYPELGEAELKELHAVGMRFCQPAVNNMPKVSEPEEAEEEASEEVAAEAEEEVVAGVAADAE